MCSLGESFLLAQKSLTPNPPVKAADSVGSMTCTPVAHPLAIFEHSQDSK
jgi:hypothetical protein